MPRASDASRPAVIADPEFETLLEFLRDNRGFDFTGYKRASLARRIGRRMQDIGMEDYADYLDYLQVHPDEFTALFNTILINVTGFFRDPEAWSVLESQLIPELLEAKRPTQTIRVWSAGTATGAEAYSVAMLFAERLGIAGFRDRVKIYATDVDEDALAEARQGVFTERQMAGVPEALRQRWFEGQGDRFAVVKDLRRCVIFGRNDLVQDAPISRVDVLLCRNTLMYFNAETQDRILRRFHFALTETGILFLGKAETLLTQSRLFQPIDARHRLFRRIPARPDPMLGRNNVASIARADAGRDESPTAQALDVSPDAALVVSRDGQLLRANRKARSVFRLNDDDLGRPFRELDLSLRPVDLRPLLDRVSREDSAVTVRDVEWRGENPTYWDVTIAPLPGETGSLGAAIFFTDITGTHHLQADLSYANKQLETSYEELQSTVEELETTNEELQSTVEELETTNEELQSTNEELETTNEELQSTNDELQSANEELSERGAQVAAANAFMDSILRSINSAVIAVDRDLIVTAWSARAEDMWGLRSDEVVGQHLMNLDTGFPLEAVHPIVRRALSGQEPRTAVELPAVNRRGRQIIAATRVAELTDTAGATTGAILFIDERG